MFLDDKLDVNSCTRFEKLNICEFPLKRIVKPIIFSLLMAFAFLSFVSLGAENLGFEESVESRAQRATLQENGVNNLAPQPRITRRQATNIAGDRYEGRVLGIVLDNSSNNYRVRMDQDGTVFNVFVNATSGDVSTSSD